MPAIGARGRAERRSPLGRNPADTLAHAPCTGTALCHGLDRRQILQDAPDQSAALLHRAQAGRAYVPQADEDRVVADPVRARNDLGGPAGAAVDADHETVEDSDDLLDAGRHGHLASALHQLERRLAKAGRRRPSLGDRRLDREARAFPYERSLDVERLVEIAVEHVLHHGRAGGGQEPEAARDLAGVFVNGDEIERVHVVELVDLVAVLDLHLPVESVTELTRSQAEHLFGLPPIVMALASLEITDHVVLLSGSG